jgi:hypothetical protein
MKPKNGIKTKLKKKGEKGRTIKKLNKKGGDNKKLKIKGEK